METVARTLQNIYNQASMLCMHMAWPTFDDKREPEGWPEEDRYAPMLSGTSRGDSRKHSRPNLLPHKPGSPLHHTQPWFYVWPITRKNAEEITSASTIWSAAPVTLRLRDAEGWQHKSTFHPDRPGKCTPLLKEGNGQVLVSFLDGEHGQRHWRRLLRAWRCLGFQNIKVSEL